MIEPVANVETFIVEPDGTVTNCTATKNGVDVLGSKPDNPCLRQAKFAPFVDAAGKPVRRKVTLNLTLSVEDPDAKVAPPAPRKKKRR